MLVELRSKAEAATPGPWKTGGSHARVWDEWFPCVYPVAYPEREITLAIVGNTLDAATNDANADFIAAVSPDRVLALLDLLQTAEPLIMCAMDVYRDPDFQSEYQRASLKDDADEMDAWLAAFRVAKDGEQ